MAELFDEDDEYIILSDESEDILFDIDHIQPGGYDCMFVDANDPPAYLLCLICFSVAKSPQQMDCCGKLYCEKCLTQHIKVNSAKCPHCRTTGKSFKDKRAEQQILSLTVKCDHCEKGCEWTGELRSLEEHKLKCCGYTLIPCPNKCRANCFVYRKDLDNHLQHQCPKRSYSCPECGKVGKFDVITTEHTKVCPNAMVDCPNEGCTYTCWRSNLKLHKCPYVRVDCKYSNIGCTEKLLRRDIQSHESDNSHHLQLASKMVAKLNNEIAVLKEENASLQHVVVSTVEAVNKNGDYVDMICRHLQVHKQLLQTANSKINELQKENSEMKQKNTASPNCFTNQRKNTFKLFPFSSHKKNSTAFTSKFFYSSPYGYRYKFSISVSDEQVPYNWYISVYAYLMKGDHDDSLTWPFTGTFVIELLNQLEDRNHHVRLLKFPADNQVSNRVAGETERGPGFGYPKFIGSTDLAYNSDRNCQYLKSDSLFFRVSVQIPDEKPWLM